MSQVRFDTAARTDDQRRRESPWWGVHAARYRFALPYVRGARVLDIACGTGYGLPVLRSRARFVIGVDVDLNAARKARVEIGDDAAAVMVADGCHLPFGEASFDVITSFETLEHLELRAQFLTGLGRVLTPDGLCVISTPNANYTRPMNGRPRNPHHVFEYTPTELLAELKNHFSEVSLVGQVLDSRFAISPFIEDQERMPRSPRAITRLVLWRTINKMPVVVRDRLSQALWGHTLFPGENDYQFSEATVTTAPVLVAICRNGSSA